MPAPVYAAPANNAVNFNFTNPVTGYVPPQKDAVNFNFTNAVALLRRRQLSVG